MRNRGDEPFHPPQETQRQSSPLEEKFHRFVEAVFASGTALPKASKHLIAAAIASLERDAAVAAEHLGETRALGTTEAEIAEALAVVSAQAGGTQLFWIKEDYEELLGPRWRSECIPAADRSFWAFKRALFANGALPARTKQLIAIAVSSKLRCRHCTVGYIKLALKEGADKAEVAETLGVLWAVSSQANRWTSLQEATSVNECSHSGSGAEEDAKDREIVISRLYDAPRDLVFKAWTTSEHVAQWWGPNGFTNTISEMDVRPGGVWQFTMHGPDGTDYKNQIAYLEIIEPERLVYAHCGDEAVGSGQFHVTVSFSEQGSQTKLTMRMLFDSPEERDRAEAFGASRGGQQTLERLDGFLAEQRGVSA